MLFYKNRYTDEIIDYVEYELLDIDQKWDYDSIHDDFWGYDETYDSMMDGENEQFS